MKIRDVCLDDQHTFITPARTWTFPINIVDPVTEFKVDFRIKTWPASGVADTWYWPEPMPYMIQEIAIVDGSEVIFALNGAEIVALSCYDLGYTPYHAHNECWNRTARWCFPIHFGRHLEDPEWIFDPGKFRNPQMRITWDSEWLHTNQAGTYKVDSSNPVTISIWAKIMEEGARPRGYLMTKQIKEYTPTGAGDEITFLPVDFPIRKLLVRSYLFGARQEILVGHLKLSQDQDKWIPFDLRGEDFIRLMKNWFTEVQFHGYHWLGDDDTREHLSGSLSSGVVVSSTGGLIAAPTNWIGNVFKCYARYHDGTGAHNLSRVEVWSQSMTRTPFDCFCYPFGDQDNAADWLQVAGMGNLRLILTHAIGTRPDPDAYGLTQIVTQQAHPY